MDVGEMREPEHAALPSPRLLGGKAEEAHEARKPTLRLRAFHLFHLLTRPMTLGVRGAALDAAGRTFLVRHTYVPGWYMPGGGVDPGETAEAALGREFREEGNLAFGEAPALFGVYLNRHASARDHVLLYVCRGVTQVRPKEADREIADSGFFSLDALPDGTTPATRRRLAEISGEKPSALYW